MQGDLGLERDLSGDLWKGHYAVQMRQEVGAALT